MRISDWSSDVCSSDLRRSRRGAQQAPLSSIINKRGKSAQDIMQITTKNHLDKRSNRPVATIGASSRVSSDTRRPHGLSRPEQIGRASCRERVCHYVKISGCAGELKKQKVKTTRYGTHTRTKN